MKPDHSTAAFRPARRRLLRAFIAGAGACVFGARAAPKGYTLAVVPYRLPLAAHQDWGPLAEHLGERLKAHIELKVHDSFVRFEEELFRGAPDFVFMNPYHQVVAYKRAGYLPLVRSSKPLTGALSVRHDSPAASVKDLNGKILAFPSPNAFAASLYMRALLTERHKIRFTPYYLDSHNEVYRHVILGEAAGGGGSRHTLEREPPEVQAKLRVLYETPAAVSHPFAAHPRIPAAVREAATQAILDLGAADAARALLERTQLSDPVRADYRRDYRPLERLRLDRYAAVD